jgi:hypothetical protein
MTKVYYDKWVNGVKVEPKEIGEVVLNEAGNPMIHWNAGVDIGTKLYNIKPKLIAWHTEYETADGMYRELSYEYKEGFKPLYELEE